MILVSQKGELVRLLKAGDDLRLVVFTPANIWRLFPPYILIITITLTKKCCF